MTEQNQPEVPSQDPYGTPPTEAGTPSPYGQAPPPAYAPAGAPVGAPAAGPVGKIRGTGMSILLMIVTLGIYSIVWFYKTHDELKRHSGEGLGGGLALLLALLVGFVMPYLTSNEVGRLYERRGEEKPVSAMTGLWYFPGSLIIVGPIVWFVKTNGALNRYWSSLGAVA